MPRRITPDDLLALQLAGEPQLSPDGKRLAYVVARIDKEQNEYRHQLVMMEAAPGARPVPFTGGPKSDKNPRWSPDGAQLAFISNRSGKNQIWVMSTHGGEARQLTRFKEGVGCAPVWSPDGAVIAFTASVGSEGPGDESKKEDEQDLFKKYTQGVRRINRIHYKTDGEGIHDPEKREQIFIIAVATEKPEPLQVTCGPWNHTSPAWAPDGKAIAFVANRREDDDHSPFLGDVWVQDLADPGAAPVCLTPGTFSLGSPAWSPDGSRIAFTGYEHARFQSYSSNHLWVVNRDGSGLHQVDRNWDRTFGSKTSLDMPAPAGGSLTWTPDGAALIALGADCGRQQIVAVDAESGSVSSLTAGEHAIFAWSLDARCRKFAVGVTTPEVPGDIYLVEGPDLLRLTNVNEVLLAELELAPVEHYRFRTGGGTNEFIHQHGTDGLEETDGWVMKPAGFEEGKRYPAVLEVHGGPMGQYGWTFFMEFQCLAAAGYAVVYTNPRGSQGYGEKFCACIKEDWGNLDYLDVMAGLDAALAHSPWIDPERVGIAGGSYGGFMVNWALGQTERFKAAVTMRSCVNEASMVGTSDFGFADMANYPSRPWNDMTFYRRFSTITNVERIVTPLLIEHQEQDYRCPMEQAEQLYTALKVLRRTVEFVRYPESSHGMSRTGKPWLRVYRLRTIVDWFQRYMPS
jgi:dipeptidyl aminopeptidase/acylaminoacyl peptidase